MQDMVIKIPIMIILTTERKNLELILCGHSLGAGVAVLLAMVNAACKLVLCILIFVIQMWADPVTCLTVPSSGLPPDHNVSVYCIGPPYVMHHSPLSAF